MKLWQKISCIAVAVLTLIVSVCSAALLVYAKNSILSMSVERTLNSHQNLVASFTNMIRYYTVWDMGEVTRASAVQYCFSSFADETSVLIVDGDVTYTQLSIDPSEYLVPDGTDAVAQLTTSINGRRLLMLCSRTTGRQDSYDIYTVADVTDVYSNISRMGWLFALVSAAAVGTGVLLITLLVRRGMRPLSVLSASARRIAGGEYSGRADVNARDEVGMLAKDFNLMADAVEARVQELTEVAERQRLFIAGLTHEFKTPMTSVLIHSDTLLNINMTADERDRSVYHIYEQIRWLERLTQKLLRLINLNEGIETEPVFSEDLMEAAQESLRDVLDRRQTPLTIDSDDAILEVDRDLMLSAVVNLIDNASKASQPGSPIEVTARRGVITVKDHGCGIPKEEIDRICEPFYMVDRSRSKKQGGSGLGLALVREIVRAHGGTLSFESEEGRGTVATLTIC